MTTQQRMKDTATPADGDNVINALRKAFEKTTLQNQHTSPLLRLPGEVRTQIYTHALAVDEIELCGEEPCKKCGNPYQFRTRPDLYKVHYPRKLLDLLLVCHQIYVESRLLPFSMNRVMGIAEGLAVMYSFKISTEHLSAVHTIAIQLHELGLRRDYEGEIAKSLARIAPVLERLPSVRVIELLWVGGIRNMSWEELEESLMELAEETLEVLLSKDVRFKVSQWHCCAACDKFDAQDEKNEENGEDEDDDEDEEDEGHDESAEADEELLA